MDTGQCVIPSGGQNLISKTKKTKNTRSLSGSELDRYRCQVLHALSTITVTSRQATGCIFQCHEDNQYWRCLCSVYTFQECRLREFFDDFLAPFVPHEWNLHKKQRGRKRQKAATGQAGGQGRRGEGSTAAAVHKHTGRLACLSPPELHNGPGCRRR